MFYKGTPAQYLQELKAAAEVAHSRGIKCTNGGLVSSLVAFLVADHYKEIGQIEKSNTYLRWTLGDDKYQKLRLKPKLLSQQIAKGKELISGYQQAGADFVNFHWYIADTDALREAVRYLTEITGLPVITNEIGQQKNEDPSQVTNVMQAIVDLNIPIAVWFCGDVPGYGQARSLVNRDGTLRPNGSAYKRFISQNYAFSDRIREAE